MRKVSERPAEPNQDITANVKNNGRPQMEINRIYCSLEEKAPGGASRYEK